MIAENIAELVLVFINSTSRRAKDKPETVCSFTQMKILTLSAELVSQALLPSHI